MASAARSTDGDCVSRGRRARARANRYQVAGACREAALMRFDTRTIVLVTKRLVELSERPPLFHDRITPAVVSRRLDRVSDWLGFGGRHTACEYIRRHRAPPPGDRQWGRAAAAAWHHERGVGVSHMRRRIGRGRQATSEGGFCGLGGHHTRERMEWLPRAREGSVIAAVKPARRW